MIKNIKSIAIWLFLNIKTNNSQFIEIPVQIPLNESAQADQLVSL
jgi:hypothetical protein